MRYVGNASDVRRIFTMTMTAFPSFAWKSEEWCIQLMEVSKINTCQNYVFRLEFIIQTKGMNCCQLDHIVFFDCEQCLVDILTIVIAYIYNLNLAMPICVSTSKKMVI